MKINAYLVRIKEENVTRYPEISTLILFMLCLLFMGCEGGDSTIVGRVGEMAIYQEDLDLRTMAYENCYDKKNTDDVSILAECIRDGLEYAVLKSYFCIEPSETVLAQKLKWIDINTKDPPVWECIKLTYTEHRDALSRNVLRPILVNQQLHELFAGDTLIHNSQRDSIRVLKQKVSDNPDALSSIAGYDTFFTKRTTDSLILAIASDVPNRGVVLERVLSELSPGEISKAIVEDAFTYRIVKLLHVRDTGYVWSGIVIPKRSFDNWFRKYACGNVRIEIYDKRLSEEFNAQYNDIWWKDCFVELIDEANQEAKEGASKKRMEQQ